MTAANWTPDALRITDEEIFEGFERRLGDPEASAKTAQTREQVARILQNAPKETPKLEGIGALRALASDPGITDEAFFDLGLIFFVNKIDFNSK